MKPKIKRCRRAYNEKELEHRRHLSNVRHLKKWCEEHNLECRTWEDAQLTDICVVSTSDYDLYEERSTCVQDNDSYFLSPVDYETWCEEA